MPGGRPHIIVDKFDESSEVKPMDIDATFHDRDGKKYPAIILKEFVQETEFGERGGNKDIRNIKLLRVAVNFHKVKGKEDWRTIHGVSEDRPAAHKPKQWVERKSVSTKEKDK